jgi:hypothetical protein
VDGEESRSGEEVFVLDSNLAVVSSLRCYFKDKARYL